MEIIQDKQCQSQSLQDIAGEHEGLCSVSKICQIQAV
jgi:hypothetical protein